MGWASRAAGCICSVGLLGTLAPAARADEAPQTDHGLPPVVVEDLRAKARQPQWDTGLLAGICGVGSERLWQRTRFCGGGTLDAYWGRGEEHEAAFGTYTTVSTAGFRDVRWAIGASVLVPLKSWIVTAFKLGPLMRIEGGVAPGLQAVWELGQRSFRYDTRYSLSQTFFVGFDWTAAVGEMPTGSALWLGLRIDGYWLTAPAMLFQL